MSGDRAVAAAPPDAASAAPPWPFAERFAFTFTCILFFLQTFPFPFDYIPAFVKTIVWTDKLWDIAVAPLAKHVFHVATGPAGGGDSVWRYIQVALFFAIALAGGLLWAALDRKRSHFERAYELFRIYLRYSLAAAMISYGAMKVIQSQFAPPTLDRLVTPFGSSSPMGILWAFMGVSKAYNVFTGAIELASGILLTFRRTTLLGALIAAGAMANVVALNYSYDVSVKIYSTQLLLEAVVLVAPDVRRLLDVLLFDVRPLFRKQAFETTSLVVRTSLVAGFIAFVFYDVVETSKVAGLGQRSPLRGVWEVNELTDNGVARPPLTTDATRWRRVVFDNPTNMSVFLMNDTRTRFNSKLDEKTHTLKLRNRENRSEVLTLTYARPSPRVLTLDGVVAGHAVHAKCDLSDAYEKPLLLTRGFHWVNEISVNR